MATLWFGLGPALRQSRADVLDDLQVARRRRRRRGPAPLPAVHPLAAAQSRAVAGAAAGGRPLRADGPDGHGGGPRLRRRRDRSRRGRHRARRLRRRGALEVIGRWSGACAPFRASQRWAPERSCRWAMHLAATVARAGIEPPDARPATPEAGRAFETPWNAVSRDYFTAMGVRCWLAAHSQSTRPSRHRRRRWRSSTTCWRGSSGPTAPHWASASASASAAATPPTTRSSASSPPRTSDPVRASLPGGVFVPLARGRSPGQRSFTCGRRSPPGLAGLVRDAARQAAPGLAALQRAHLRRSHRRVDRVLGARTNQCGCWG